MKILVVDDDETLCRTAVEALDSIGIQSDWCMSGEKALEMVTKHHRMRDDYQIVLLDWKTSGNGRHYGCQTDQADRGQGYADHSDIGL